MLDCLVFVPSLMQWTAALAVTLVVTLSASRHRLRSGIPMVALRPVSIEDVAMIEWTDLFPTFLTAAVEWVEAFTIVLAVSLSIGWRAALGPRSPHLAPLPRLTVVTGGVLASGSIFAGCSW